MVSQEIFEKVQTEIEAGSPEGSGENDALPEHSEENHAGDRDAVTERATIVADVSLPNSSGPTRVGMSKSPPPIKVEDSEEREEEPGEHVDVSTTTTGEALTLEEVFVKEEDLGGIVDGAFISVYTPEDLEPILEAAKDPSNAKYGAACRSPFVWFSCPYPCTFSFGFCVSLSPSHGPVCHLLSSYPWIIGCDHSPGP